MTSTVIVIGLGVLTNMLVDRPGFKDKLVAKFRAATETAKAEYAKIAGKQVNTVIVGEKTKTNPEESQ